MPINLANVNISIQQFQSIASGKYNAGEVTLASETTLGKINNRIHFTGSNTKSLSHQEVLAIKNALVRALSTNGVGQEEINRIRRELGLAAESGIDKTLHERSIKPLTRQQVREILDRNAETINTHANATIIRTSDEMNAGKTERVIQDRKDARDDANATLTGARETQEHLGLIYAEAIVASDVDFRTYDESKALLRHARSQLKRLLETTGGHPSTEREAVVEFRMKGTYQQMRIATGLSEAAYVRKLEEMIIRLAKVSITDERSRTVRAEFGALNDPVARREWLDGLAGAPDAGFKIRTAVIMMLTNAGIDDWETLSLINRVNDEVALDAAKTLVMLNGQKRGNALRDDVMMQALTNLAANGAEVPANARASIPATSPHQWNQTIKDAIDHDDLTNLPHEFKALLDEVPGHLRELFGSEIVGAKAKAKSFFGNNAANVLVPNLDAAPITAESLRGLLMARTERGAAEKCVSLHLDRMLMAAGLGDGSSAGLLKIWTTTRPQLKEHLFASHSATEIANIFAEERETIEADVKRFATVKPYITKVASFYKEALAREMGVPSACFAGEAVDMTIISNKATELADQILEGKIEAAIEADIEAIFKNFAETTAAKRATAFRSVDGMDLPPELRDNLKAKLFTLNRVDKLDLAKTIEAARNAFGDAIDALDAALVPNAPKETVYTAMGSITGQLKGIVDSLFPPGAEVGAEELNAQGNIIMATVIYSKPGLMEKLIAFFDRADVKADNTSDPKSLAYNSDAFLRKVYEVVPKAELANSLGTPSMPPFHAQALMQAFEDAGLGGRTIAEKMAILRPSHPAGALIAAEVREAQGIVSPSKLREIATPILQTKVGAAPIARSQGATERMNALLAKYEGGLKEADRARLREFAEALDFSKNAAAASEKILAERLDDICGGGGFNNPASSASRRALASGFKLADLPALARIAEALDGYDNTPIETLLNPQSDFRKKWDAAHQRFAGDNETSAADKIAIAQAIIACDDDAELLTIVMNGIRRAVRAGDGHIRTEDGINEVVERTRNNLQELREVSAGDPALFGFGLGMLQGLETRRVPNGFIKHMVDAVRQIPLEAVQKLRARSSAREIHAAITQLYGNVATILRSGDSQGLLEGDDEVAACRVFLFEAMISRLDQRTRNSICDALTSENASKLVRFYDMLALGEIDFGALPLGISNNVERLGTNFSNHANLLIRTVRRSLGDANADDNVVPFAGEFNRRTANEIGAEAILTDIKGLARTECEEACDIFIQRLYPGNSSPAAVALRNIYRTSLDITKPFKPGEELTGHFSFATRRMLNLNIVRGVKFLATDGLPLSQFAKDRNRNMNVFLPDGRLLSTDAATAADELARFVTGREDATYEGLGQAEKTKVHIVMSLLTQEANTATIDGSLLALDPEGKNPAFNYGGNGAALTRAFHLSKDVHGGIEIKFETTLRPSHLLLNGDLIQLGQGSEVKGSFNMTLTEDKLNTMSNLDFTTCDNTAAEEMFNRHPSVDNKLTASLDLLPRLFRFDLSPETSFSVKLN